MQEEYSFGFTHNCVILERVARTGSSQNNVILERVARTGSTNCYITAEFMIHVWKHIALPAAIVTAICALLSACTLDHENSEVCFIGDSITRHWDLEHYFPDFLIHKHAVSGAVIQDIDNWDISDCNGIPTFFLMGTNNIGMFSANNPAAETRRKDFVNELIPRLQRINADPLLFISILPRNVKGKQSKSVSQNIELQNELIVNTLDSMHFNYKYIDVFDAFLEEGYSINEDLFNDGLHPSPMGYELLTSKVLPYL